MIRAMHEVWRRLWWEGIVDFGGGISVSRETDDVVLKNERSE